MDMLLLLKLLLIPLTWRLYKMVAVIVFTLMLLVVGGYLLKERMGLNLIDGGGYHTLKACVQKEIDRVKDGHFKPRFEKLVSDTVAGFRGAADVSGSLPERDETSSTEVVSDTATD